MADEPKAANKTDKPEDAPKKSKAPLLIVAVVVLLGAGGAAGWYFLHHSKTAEASTPADTNEYVLHLETFTVNLADQEEGHFLRTTIDLGLGHPPKGAEGKGPGDFPVARARDAILSVLTIGKADVLLTPDGKAQLKHDLLQALQEKVPDGDVRSVYFTEFIVQR